MTSKTVIQESETILNTARHSALNVVENNGLTWGGIRYFQPVAGGELFIEVLIADEDVFYTISFIDGDHMMTTNSFNKAVHHLIDLAITLLELVEYYNAA